MTTSNARPALAGIHHVAITVSDVEASAAWYERVLGLQRLPAPCHALKPAKIITPC